jgi:hypothetical protein
MAKRKTSGWTLAGIGAEHGAEAAAVLVTYLGELRAIRRSGAAVDETSYDPALAGLFTTVGQQLKPKVRCVMNLRNTGAGMPDGGLFTAAQFERQSDGAIKRGQLPSRGAMDVKGTKADVNTVAESEQVGRYLQAYGLVILTNTRSNTSSAWRNVGLWKGPARGAYLSFRGWTGCLTPGCGNGIWRRSTTFGLTA